MNKKLTICIIAAVAAIISCILIFSKNDSDKMKLSSKYYGKGEYIEITSKDITSLSKDTYLLFVYNNYCAFQVPCDKVFAEFMEKYEIDILSIPFEDFKSTDFYKTVLYAPSVILVKENKIIDYLDANKDADIDKYQDSNEFAKWVKKYISLNK